MFRQLYARHLPEDEARMTFGPAEIAFQKQKAPDPIGGLSYFVQ
jgi:hypothetical protein